MQALQLISNTAIEELDMLPVGAEYSKNCGWNMIKENDQWKLYNQEGDAIVCSSSTMSYLRGQPVIIGYVYIGNKSFSARQAMVVQSDVKPVIVRRNG